MSPEELPFETAPELVEEIAADLGLPEPVTERADELAHQVGGLNPDHPISHAPSVTAAACVYIAHSRLRASPPLTQRQVAQAADISPLALRNARDRMVRSEEVEL